VTRCLLLAGSLALGACRYDVDRAALGDGGPDETVDPPIGDDSRPAGSSDGPTIIATDGGNVSVVDLDEASVIDTYIHESTGAANGSDPTLFLDGAPQDRILVRFDVTSIPAGSFVTRADLVVEVVDVNSSEPIRLHAIEAAWTEADATWTQRTPTELWTTPGGDVGPALTSQFYMDTLGSLAIDVTGIAQDWVDGSAPNYGVAFILTGTSEAHIAARDAGGYGGPVLRVFFE
jgi:hypothetical protein